MAVASVTIQGVDKIIRRMAVLPLNVEKRVVSGAVRKSLATVSKEAKRRGRKQKRSGLLAKSLGVKVKAYPRKGVTVGLVGPRKGYKDTRTGEIPAYIAHLVEGGTKKHTVTTKGGGLANTKDVAFGFQATEQFFGKSVQIKADPKPFLKPAYDAKKNESERTFAASMEEGVHREAAKLGVIS